MHNHEFMCADCGKASPPTPEGETITKQHGWRVSRKVVGGVIEIQARCAECFARHRSSRPPATTAPAPRAAQRRVR